MKNLYKTTFCILLIFCFFSHHLIAQNFQSASQIGGSGDDIAGEIKLDAQGNQYILGLFGGTAFTEMVDIDPTSGVLNCFTYGGTDLFLIKISAQGTFLWGTSFGGTSNDEAFALELDASGHAYVTGTYQGKFQIKNGNPLFASLSNSSDVFVCKFDGSNGNLLNSLSIGSTGNELGVDLDLASNGDIYLTGNYGRQITLSNGTVIDPLSVIPFPRDIYMIRLDPSFNPIWGKGIGNTSQNRLAGIELGPNDETNILFTHEGSIDVDPAIGNTVNISGTGTQDLAIARYDQNGNYISHFSLASTGFDILGDFVIDDNNDIFITGDAGGLISLGGLSLNPQSSHFFLVKIGYNYTAQLAEVWDGAFFPAPSISFDQSGNIYLAGLFQQTVDFNNDPGFVNSLSAGSLPGNYVLKLDPSADFIWVKKIGETFFENRVYTAIDQNDLVYTIGSFQNTQDFDPSNGVFNMTSFQNTVDFFYHVCSQGPLPPPRDFTKLYGDTLDHRARDILHIDGDVYLASEVHRNGEVYGVFSKFDDQGALVWEHEFDRNTSIRDVAYDPKSKTFILVGHQGYFQIGGVPQDNLSFIQTIDDKGICGCQLGYDQLGREGFDRVILHPNPKDNSFPFYALGTLNNKNLPAPSADNIVRLWNLDNNCNINWIQEYEYPNDNEFHRGLVPLLDGDLLLLGNDSPANDGILVEVDGGTGQVNIAKKMISTKIDLYDGIHVSTKSIILVGTDFSNNEAVVLHLDAQYNLRGGIAYEDIVDFRNLGKDQYDFIYTTGSLNPMFKPENLVSKIQINGDGSLSKIWNKYINTSLEPTDQPYLFVDELRDHIYYADTRISNSIPNFGQNDVLFGVFDLDFNSMCMEDYGIVPKNFNVEIQNASIGSNNVMENAINVFKCTPAKYACTDPCAPVSTICQADFTWIANCFEVDFTDQSTASATISTWEWDVDCDGILDYTSQNPTHIFPGCGNYDVCLRIIADDGCASDTMMSVIVEDQVDPILMCSDINVGVAGCARGRNVSYSVSASDNCGIDTIIYSHQTGDFFPCGNTLVSVTAIDSCGNSTQCSFNVFVDCACARIVSSNIACTAVDTVFEFTYQIEDLSGSPLGTTCTILTYINQAGVVLTSSNLTWISPTIAEITGTVTVTTPLPLSLTLVNDFSCVCSDGNPIMCTIPVHFSTPCCLNIDLDDDEICEDEVTTSIALNDCSNLDGATYVNWFISNGPCATANFTPIQTAGVCDPLIINPQYHSGSICVYAEVLFDASNPCSLVRTDTATIELCKLPSCSIPMQEYCYTGQSILPSLLQLNIPPSLSNCDLDIQWYEKGVLVPGANADSYQPGTINYTLGPNDCFEDNTDYQATLTNACGSFTCVATIRLFNEAAPMGTLDIDPFEATPFCPGEDATLKFDPNCVGEPPRWTWSSSLDGITFNLLNNGDRSPQFNTNQLYQSTWYQVNSQNGVCPEDSIDLLIEVYPETTISSFTADHQCDLNSVDLQLIFTPDQSSSTFPCDYTIDWYKDGVLIHTDVQGNSPANYTYTSPDKGGNYQAVLRNNCCPDQVINSQIINVPSATKLIIAGPCFRCNDQVIDLEAIVINPQGTGCILEWRDEHNNLLSNSSTVSIPSNLNNFITLSRICNGNCNLMETYLIKQCGRKVSVQEILDIDLSIYPNPSTGRLVIDFDKSVSEEFKIAVFDINGKHIESKLVESGSHTTYMDISSYVNGIYLLEISNKEGLTIRKKIIKL